MYTPKPLDTSMVTLDAGIIALTEQLAKNNHEVWAAARIKDGWRYGKKRDDAKKLHPCLVPYEELPDSEKAYDRGTSLEALKLIVLLGYKIEKRI